MSSRKKDIVMNIITYALITITVLSIDLFVLSLSKTQWKQLEYADSTPIIFTLIYCLIACMLYYFLPKIISIIFFAVSGTAFFIIAVSQIFYYRIFTRIYGFADTQYAGEGVGFTEMLGSYVDVWLVVMMLVVPLLIVLLCIHIKLTKKLRRKGKRNYIYILPMLILIFTLRIVNTNLLGETHDIGSWNAWDNARNIYINYNNPLRAYQVSGFYEYNCRSAYLLAKENILPSKRKLVREIDDYFNKSTIENEENDFTEIFKDKNLIMIMMETIDTWQVTEQVMPSLSSILNTGINFTDYYATFFGGGATINSELASLTGLYKSTDQNDLSDLSQKSYSLSLPNLFKNKGYTVNSFHYNTGTFYNRSIFHNNLGFTNHYALLDIHEFQFDKDDDSNMARDDTVYNLIAPKQDKPFMSFITTYSAHLPYNQDRINVKIIDTDPNFIIDGDAESTAINILSNETDTFFKILLERLEQDGLLDDTVIILYGDHFNYGYSDRERIEQLKGTNQIELISRVPFVIWDNNMPHIEITKPVQTIDILPTVANMFGLDYNAKKYLRADVFSSHYNNMVYFLENTWWDGYDFSADLSDEKIEATDIYRKYFVYTNKYIQINNAIMKTNYYAEKNKGAVLQ